MTINLIKTIATNFICILLFSISSYSQIDLDNPSFEFEIESEFESTAGIYPDGWMQLEHNSSPDILPGSWGVYDDAYDKETYIGLVSREDGSTESIGQGLHNHLKKDSCYTITVAIATSLQYTGYNKSINKLAILGIHKPFEIKFQENLDYSPANYELLAESPPITNNEWKEFEFEFTPTEDFNFILFKLFINNMPDINIERKGNLLLDKVGLIEGCSNNN